MKPLLSKAQQTYWLKEHIRSRIYAVKANPERIKSMHSMLPKNSQSQDYLKCVSYAASEGRYIAMRWLIEFLGVEAKASFVTVICFDGGIPLQRESKDYIRLKKIWIECSQATSHPIKAERHPNVSPMEMHEVAKFIMFHLAATIYLKAGIAL